MRRLCEPPVLHSPSLLTDHWAIYKLEWHGDSFWWAHAQVSNASATSKILSMILMCKTTLLVTCAVLWGLSKVKVNAKEHVIVCQIMGIQKKIMFMENYENMWHHCYFRHLYWFVHEERVSWTAFKFDTRPAYFTLVPPYVASSDCVFFPSSCGLHNDCLMIFARNFRNSEKGTKEDKGGGSGLPGRALMPPLARPIHKNVLIICLWP